MPLNSSEENISGKSGILPSKSPRYARRKRLCNQTRRSHALKDKLNLKHEPQLDSYSESSLKSSLNNQNFPDFSSFLPPEKVNHLPTGTQSNSYLHCSGLKRSFSFPMVYPKSSSRFSSKSCSSLGDGNQIFGVPLSHFGSTTKTLANSNEISKVNNENSPASIPKINSFENIACEYAVSQRSNASTVYERNSSIDSTISQISVIDMKEVEFLETENRLLNSSSGWKAQHSRSKSDFSMEPHQFVDLPQPEVFSLPSSFSECPTPPRKSIFEGKQMVVPTECFFPRPHQGQSLTSFLSSNDFNNSAELDRENAHFYISEALIAAIEHMKCYRKLKLVEEENESDEEIRKLKQRIRIRKRERQREKTMKTLVLLSDGRTDTTTSQSASPPVSSHSSDFDGESIGSEDEIEDLELNAGTDSNLASVKESGLSLSMASLYSDADIHKGPLKFKDTERNSRFQDSDSNNLSAESVALSLLRKFSDKHLPKASELQWLVSEQEAPQRLLPLPDSWPVSPDVIEEEYKMRLRGNFEWAPPRPQIIFSILPNLKRKDIMEKQKYRCAGCGMKIEKNYVNRFRYCNYFGKYFCQCCHSNGTSYIPGRIIWKWDFTKYYVSKFAWDLLDQLYSDPLFNVEDINCNLYKKVRQLELCRVLRMQLFYLKNFISTCRKAENIQDILKKENQYILHEPHMYSLSDFLLVKNGELVKHFRHLIHPCIEHVRRCILCQAKGFICEICRKDKDIIFPFQLDKVVLCQACGSCFHKKCFKNVKCPRCDRIAKRKSRLKQEENGEEVM